MGSTARAVTVHTLRALVVLVLVLVVLVLVKLAGGLAGGNAGERSKAALEHKSRINYREKSWSYSKKHIQMRCQITFF